MKWLRAGFGPHGYDPVIAAMQAARDLNEQCRRQAEDERILAAIAAAQAEAAGPAKAADVEAGTVEESPD